MKGKENWNSRTLRPFQALIYASEGEIYRLLTKHRKTQADTSLDELRVQRSRRGDDCSDRISSSMPGLNGIAGAAALEDLRPDIVFVTAFDQYATDAFLIKATDYLLKPLKPERLRLAIDRAGRRQIEMRP